MPKIRFKRRLAALAVGVLLAALPMTATSAQAAGGSEPAVPTAQGFVASGKPTCSTDSSAPTLLGDTTPDLTAVVHLAAGGSPSGYLRAHFDVQARAADQTWNEKESELVPSSGFVTDGQVVTTSVRDPLTEGTLYRMAASTWSYATDGTEYVSSPSTASTSGWCYFTVDPTGPLAPVVTSGGPYTLCTADDCAAHGGPGVPGTFTFAPGEGDSGVVAYQYRFADSAWAQVSGSPATVTLTPRDSGQPLLVVQAQDATGGWGAQTQVFFKVAPPAPSVGLWHFDHGQPGDTSTAASDTATGAGDRHAAALSGTGADWTALGRRGDGDQALTLDGSAGYAATSGPVLDPAASFAVSAWVFPTDLAQDRTVLSQTGDDGSGFALRYAAGDRTWQFSYAWNDSAGTRHVAYAEAPGGADHVWTQLAGAYDSAAHTLTLYVNGRPQGSPVALPDAATARTASGDLEFGRAATADGAGSSAGYWKGLLDEVQVWQRTLSASEALQDAKLESPDNGWPGVANVAAWNASGAGGATLPDTSGYGHTLTTEGGALLDGNAIVLDGTDGAASTPGTVVDDTGSFTVTALVQPDMSVISGKPDGWTAQVVGQRSADGSAWGIWYRVAGHDDDYDPGADDPAPVPATEWLFGRVGTDGAFTGAVSQEVTIWTPGTADNPVQVTGVFDAQAGTASLYTGSDEQGTVPFTPVPGSGDLTVGKADLDGTGGSYFPGRVTSLGLWAGAMGSNGISGLNG